MRLIKIGCDPDYNFKVLWDLAGELGYDEDGEERPQIVVDGRETTAAHEACYVWDSAESDEGDGAVSVDAQLYLDSWENPKGPASLYLMLSFVGMSTTDVDFRLSEGVEQAEAILQLLMTAANPMEVVASLKRTLPPANPDSV